MGAGEVHVTLNMSQVRHIEPDAKRLPSDLTQDLVFASDEMSKLQKRIKELGEEKAALRKRQKTLRQEHVALHREQSAKAERISELPTLDEPCTAVLARHRLHCCIQDLLHWPRHLRIPAAYPLVVAREGEQLLELALPLELLLARRRRARPGRRRGRRRGR